MIKIGDKYYRNAMEAAYKALEESDKVKTNADEALEKSTEAVNSANEALSMSIENSDKISKNTTALRHTWEKDFVDLYLEPSMFDENLIYTIENEMFDINNIITVSASPDNNTTIVDNAKNCSLCGLTPLEQTESGKIQFKVEELPTENLYLRIMVESQMEV